MRPAVDGEPADDGAFVDRGAGVPDRLVRLWAPYRMNYITDSGAADRSGDGGQGRRDPFLRIPELDDEEGLIVARGEFVYCVLNLYPYNSGHMMVVPYRKVANLEDLTADESGELMSFAQTAVKTVKSVSSPDAINVGLNLGRASGGSVGDHLHMHIVPRWSGDANFMTVIDGTKVLPQLLRDTRRLLAEAWTGRTAVGGGPDA
ncbi:HIT family protein [Corynebacterium pygosceleis]|uniref:HIT domain-containing protein n=1 Tax=Corynebacterium pygosceleis TaxID=2800406 RepID=A0A9Q4C644_9CORY|nr:HIT domain-containing protein [Corynebacterium pygosceleis]MCK7636916.1 HIT domain-containing protein [Corynebacterium pygosceleis]MCK7674390.1 HIT domain-containing protein [Corynebacterium pygosceleis]MCL0120312.1 HIT domain-containing protein [Corynebacterium pygosceleis]MCX7467669.1 HIT domain-containing protein [Corynebacterium pygosceleis]